MREIRTSGLTSGDGKRSVAAWPKPPRPSSTLQIRGKKRHVLIDTEGLLLHAIVHAADIQDREGGVLLMATLFGLYPFRLKLYADGGYQGPQVQGRSSRAAYAGSCAKSTWRSSSVRMPQRALWCSRSVGLSNAPSRG